MPFYDARIVPLSEISWIVIYENKMSIHSFGLVLDVFHGR